MIIEHFNRVFPKMNQLKSHGTAVLLKVVPEHVGCRDLRVHHDAVPVLQEQQAGLAKLNQAQPQPQQMLHQGWYLYFPLHNCVFANVFVLPEKIPVYFSL